MKFAKLLALAATLVAATTTYAQQIPYVDPALRSITPAAAVALRPANAFDVARVSVFVLLADEGGIAELIASGARIGSRVGNIVTADLPIDRLPALFTSSHFRMFEAAREVRVQHDSSMKAIRANLVRRAQGGVWTGTTGQGVIVGIYDTGLDFNHDDFLDGAGNTRVLALWDQTVNTGTPPAGFVYGTFCSRAAIQQTITTPSSAACPEQDSNGHGTHVAGTAAGDGSAIGVGGTPFQYAGVAPLADLIIVKGGNGLFSETSIVDGLVFLERQARLLSRPMVVNLSLGSQAGAHDGSRLYETVVDSLSRAGFIVVFSAGNEGTNSNDKNPDGSPPTAFTQYFHGSGLAGPARDFTIEISPYLASTGVCNDFVNFSLWYEAGDAFEVTIVRPDGGIVTAPFRQTREIDSPNGNVRIDNGSNGPNPRNNAYEADIRINDCGTGSPPVAGLWTLRVSTIGSTTGKRFHFWMYAQNLGGASVARGRLGFDNHYIVSSPGNARSAITVGAFATRMCWNSPAKPEGPVCFVTREDIGDLARFSSGGPTRDRRLKPEITAPGMAVVSSRSRSSFPAANRVVADGVHVVNQGTSMAAPHVTGTIALMLEKNPTLSPLDVKDVFSRASDHDAFTSRVYDNSPDAEARFWWGYGKLNVCAALGALGSGGAGVGPVVITPRADTIPVNATSRFYSCSPTGASVTFRSSNTEVATIDANGLVRGVQTGTALLIASSGTFADTAVIIVTGPATLAARLRSIAPDTATRSTRGARLPLLSTVLKANGFESIRVTQLTYKVSGFDASARVLLIADVNRNGAIDFGERTIAAKTVVLTGAPVRVDLTIDSLTVAQRDSVHLITALELSGTPPNATQFTAEFVPEGTRTTGSRSFATNRTETPTGTLISKAAITTVLRTGVVFAMSENPVRSGRVIFSFSLPPTVARIYTLTGRMVTDLKARLTTPGSVIWDLTNDAGQRIATGVYIVAFDFGSGVLREKLFVINGTK